MNYTQMMTAIALSLLVGSATADCLSSVMPQKDGAITWSDLAKYDACLKADKATAARAPLTLAQATWAAACSSGSFTSNKCFGGNPASDDETKLVLQVTNLYAIANLSLTATYPDQSIWIGYFPENLSYGATTGSIPAPGTLVQAVCGAFTEIGWGIPSTGLNLTTTFGSGSVAPAVYLSGVGASGPGLTMLSNSPAALKTPLYIICVGRNTTTFAPAALPSDFVITWATV